MALPRVLSVIPVVVCALALPPAATAQTGSISGTVVFEGVAPGAYPPIRVEAHDPYQGDAFWPPATGWADSDPAGTFSVTGLAPGKYRVYFNPWGSDRAFQWYPDKVVPSGAHLVTVGSGDTSLGEVTLHPGYTIGGEVTLSPPDSGSLTQIWIDAHEASTGEKVSSGPLDAVGQYARTNLPAGKYHLWAWTGSTGYIHEVWPGSIYSSGATPMPVNASVPNATADFSLEQGRTVSGHVSLAGAPLQGANVNAWIQGACCFDVWGNSDAAGFYQIKGLPQGTYRLRVQGGISPGGQAYTGKRYNNRSSFDQGDDLVVGGADVEHIDFSPETGRTIEGRVCLDQDLSGTCEAGEQGLSMGITVSRKSDGACCEWSGSDGSGSYRVAVTDGDYVVQSDPPANLIREYWQNKSFWEDADGVTVSGDDVTSIDFSLVEGSSVGNGLEGRVVGTDGVTGIPGVDVQLNRWTTGSGVAGVRSGPDGYFRFLNLPAGDYRVYFNTGNSNGINDQDHISEYWTRCQVEPAACPEGVIDPSVQKVSYPARTSLGDFQLQAGGSISGTVCVGDVGSACPANDPGLPAGLWVSLESVVSMGPGSAGPPNGQVDSDGTYRIRGIPAPASYRVRVDPWGTGYSQAYYVAATESTPFWSLATPVEVEISGHQPSRDLHLTPGGTISGHVYCGAGAGEPIPNMQVNGNMNGPGVWYGRGVQTDANGVYVLDGLPPGDYEVRTDGRGQAGSTNCPSPANETYPSMISILATETVPNIDFSLEPGTSISGKVEYRVAGVLQPLVNLRVSATDWETGQYVSDDNTDLEGNYTIQALPTGRSHRVQVNTRDGHLDPQFWNFVQETWDDDPTGQGSPVAGGATGVDFELELGGAISGRVTAEGGTPLTGVNVSAWDYDKNGAWNNANTDQNGFYIIRGLPAARYNVYANPQPRNYVPEYYDNVIGGVPPTPVTVTQDPDTVSITENINFELAPGVVIRGRVHSAGGGLKGIRLVAYQTEPPQGWSGEVVTGVNGEYEIVGLFPGDWRVEVLTLGTDYAYQKQDRSLSAAGLPCTDSGGRTDCVDFDLRPGSTLRFYAYEDKDLDGTCISSDAVKGVGPRIEFWDTRESVSSTGWWSFQTDEEGAVTVSGLPAGRFRVRMQGGGFVTTYYDRALRQGDADPFDLGSQDDKTLTFCLVRGRTISGRVFYDRNADGVQTPNANPDFDEPGVANVCLNASTPWGAADYFGYGSCTNADGDYTITGVLPVYPYPGPGGTPVQYQVRADAQGTPWASEYFDRVPDGAGPALGTFKRTLAEIVTVDGGDRTGIDFSLVLGGGVKGTVTDDSTGAFLAGIQINVNPVDGDADGHGATTDPSGRYIVTGLPPGSYQVEARDNRNGLYVREYYDDKFFSNEATPVPVAARANAADPLASTADFALEKGGAIEGVVYEDMDGSKSFTAGDVLLSNVNIVADRFAQPNWWINSTNTRSDGTYRLAGLPAGLALRVRADTPSGTDLITAYYDGATNGDQGTANGNQAASVTIPAPGDTVSDIRFAMTAGGSISGLVTDESASPVPLYNVNVCASPVSSGSWFCTSSGRDGTYGIRGIAPGLYRVQAGGNPTGHRLEYYDDTLDWNLAAQIPVTAGADRPGVNFALGVGGAISGDVVDAAGAPIPGITLCANPLTSGLGSCDQTDSLGHYLIQGLPAGSYRVNNTSGSAYRVEYYDNQTDSNAATPVTVTPPGETAGINFVLVRQPRILAGPTPASGVRGTTVTGVQVTIDGAAGGVCGSPPCVSVSLGSAKLHVLNPSLFAGVLTFDLQIDTDAPLGKHTLSVVNDYTVEDAAAVKTNAFEILGQTSPPVPSTGDRVYVLEAGTSLIRVASSVDYSEADAVPGDPATAIEVCCQPQDIVLSPDAQRAYVLGGDRAIGIVDLRLGREVGRIPTDTGSGFYGVAVTASHVYVADRRLNDRILVFDSTTGAKVTEVMLGTAALPFGLRLHPDGRHLYVAVRGSTTTPAAVAVVDTTTQGVLATAAAPTGVSPLGFAFRPDGQSGFLQTAVGTYLLNTTNPASPVVGSAPIVNARGGNGVIEVAPWAGRLLAYVPVAGGRLWIMDVTTDTPAVLANLTLGLNLNRVKPSSDGSKAFVLHGNSQDLYAVDVEALLASPASVPATRVGGLVVPTALAVAPIPGTPPAGRPAVSSVSPSEVVNGGTDILVTVTGSNFVPSPKPVVWLAGTQVRGTVTSASPTSLAVTFPPTTPTGRHLVVVTNSATGESGINPAITLDVSPPDYVHGQALFNSSFGTAGIDVFASDGSRDFIPTEPFPAAIAITPDGRLGLVNHTYTGPRYSSSETVASQQQDTALFELDPAAPPSTFRKVVATLPYVFGGSEPPVFTPDLTKPVFGYVPNTATDTVSVVDPATRTEVDIDDNPATQSYPVDDIYMGAFGLKLPGLNRIHLDAQVTDGALMPQGTALTPDGSFLYVSTAGYTGSASIPAQAARVSIVNALTRQVVGELTKAGNGALADAYSIVIPPSGDHVFVIGMDGAIPAAPALFVYNTGTFDNEAAFVDRIPLDEVPRGLAASEDGKTVYVTLRFNGLLQAIDVTPKAGGGVEGTKHNVPIGPGPVRGLAFATVAFDDSLLYVSNNFGGAIHVFDIAGDSQTSPRLLTTLGTRCASTLAVQPATGNPRLDSVIPPHGPALGGNTVVLTGANFSAASQVRFSATPALAVLVDSAFRIRAQAPPGTGEVDVTVENPGGATATLASAYTYVADTTPPVFTTPLYLASGSEVLDGSTVKVTLRWTTNEEATTVLHYGIGSPAQSAAVSGYRTSHTVELTGLIPGATYLFQATSTDLSGNHAVDPTPPLGKQLISVPDTTPPVISDVNHSATETTATIVWQTNEAATSLVQFDGTVDGTLAYQQLVPGTRQSHSVTLANLQRNTTYEFRVRSADASDNGPTTVLAAPPYQTFTTACEDDPPAVSNVAVSYLSNDLVIISWTTNELATSWVNYGISSVNEQGVMDVSLVTAHIVFLTNLLPNQAYGFQAGSTDACGNHTVTDNPFPTGQGLVLGEQRLTQSLQLGVATLPAGTTLLTTLAATGFTTPPAPDTTPPGVTTPISVAPLGPDRVRIAVGTDEAASILARYGRGSVTEASAFDPTFTQTPGLILAGLLPNTTYLLEVVLTDPKGNATPPAGLSFHTPELPDTTAPVITNVAVGSVTQTGAIVSWQTNEPAESWVRFGPQGGGLTRTVSAPGLNTVHSIILSGLTAGTTYAFEASSRDASGNVPAAPATGSFRTAYAPPAIASVTPDRAAQGATLSVIVNGSRFDANAMVGLGDDVTINSLSVDATGTQIVANVTIGGSATWGPRSLRVTNLPSGLWDEAPFTVVDSSVPVITITEPGSGAEIVTPSVTVRGTVSEAAVVTVNGAAVTLTGSGPFAFSNDLTLPGPGAHRINVTAVDPSDNRASTSIDVKYMTLTVDDAVVAEGNAGSPQALFNLRLSTASAQAITVQYSTAPGSATPATDYVGGGGSTTIPAGSLSVPVAIAVNGDSVDEDDETFTLTLTSASGAAIVDGVATGTIMDDDGPPAISIDDVAVAEGSSGFVPATFTLTLLHPSSKNVGVSYATGGGTATGGTDYTIANGTLSFGPLETTKTLTVEVKGDLVDEPDETFFVNLSNPQNATLADAQGQVTIRDDDVGGALTVNDVSVAEGNTGTKDAVFTVSLGVPAASTITVQYTVAAGTASANDFTPNTGKLVFQVGQSSRTLAVKVKGDLFDEDDETFFVRLTSAQGAPISDGEGVGTILDDDLPPSLRVTDVTITEGNSGTKDATFVVSLSLASGKTVTVGYGTADDTAIAGSDYVATSGVLTFAPGETSKSVNVAVKGDKVKESAETFFLNLANPLNATVADAQGVGTIKDGGRGRRGRVRGGSAGLGFPPLAREDPLEERQGPAHAAGADEEVPDGLALLPPDGVGGVAQRAEKVGLRGRAPQDRAPAVEVAIGAPVALFELPRAHLGGAEDGVASVIEVPVAVQEAPLRLHPSKQLRARVGREHVEGRGLDALRDRPLHRALEDRGVVLVEAKDEARVHHDAQVVQAADGRPVVPAQVLPLALRAEALRSQRLEPHEQAPEPAGDRLFEKAGP